MKSLLLVTVSFTAVLAYDWTLYSGHQVIKVIPRDQVQLNYLQNLPILFPKLDFWRHSGRVGKPSVIRIAPEHLEHVLDQLSLNDFDVQVQSENLGEEFRVQWEALQERRERRQAFDYNDYNDLIEVYTELDAISSRCPAGFTCEVSSIGDSLQGRPVNQMFITSNENKKVVWLDSTIHAREWITVMTLMNMANRLVSEYGSNGEATSLLDRYDWYITPVVNPDGYDYSWSNDRLWRKNRRDNGYANPNCTGVDLNRNFPTNWGEPGASPDPCETTYQGPGVASEPETVNVMNKGAEVVATRGLVGWWHIHSYGNMMLLPYGNGTYGDSPQDWDVMMTNANATCDAIEATYDTDWDCGNLKDVIYETSGGVIDWCKEDLGVNYPFSPELRGDDFSPPPSEIPLSFNEMWNGLVAFVDNL